MNASVLGMILAVAACFTAAVLNLAVESRFRSAVMRTAILLAVTIGACFYGYGYSYCYGTNLTSLCRALLALCRMFGGVNDLGSISAAPLFRYPAALAVFWLGHFMAFYVTASAAIATLGERLLRRIRTTLLRRGPLVLIYGVNERSVAFGRSEAARHKAVMYVDQESPSALENSIKAFGGVVEKSAGALNATRHFLKQINMKPGNRRLEVAALDADGRKNLAYAGKLLTALTEAGIRPEQTRLLAAGAGEGIASLQALSGKGYGSVFAFNDYDLVARRMMRDHPPCDQIAFDERGKAAEDFHAVLLGFGRMGRAVLNQLVLNGQFTGSHFRADIFDPEAQNGFLHDHPMVREYDIRFHGVSGMVDAFYTFLAEARHRIRMIILCTGSREKNAEIARDVADWYPWDEPVPLILQATPEGCEWIDAQRHDRQDPALFEGDALDLESMDAMAMEVNQVYCVQGGSTLSARENWQRCDYFSRQSSRACADFFPAMLRAAGKTEEEVLAGEWPPEGEILENLARTEHLRWCAFQYVNGYASMPPEIWEQRAARYREGAEKNFRISRDPDRRLQACLIPWEALDDLSARENAATGGRVDYKQMDRNNVLILSQVLRARREAREGTANG